MNFFGNKDAVSHTLFRSDPRSSRFGQYYTPEQVHDLFGPAENTINAVMHWLESMGVGNISHTENKQWLACELPLKQDIHLC